MKKDSVLNMTEGNPYRLILTFGLPVMFGIIFQEFYHVVDSAIVGKALGGSALAAVGATGSINTLIIGGCTGICSGFSIPVAQQIGAKNDAEVRRYVINGTLLCLLLTVLLTTAGPLLCRDILIAMNTPEDIFQRSYSYIFTILAGLPAYLLYNYTTGILRALGDSRSPVIWLSVASIVNIVLDLLFILAFRLDVFGAALATDLSQALAGIGCLWSLIRKHPVLRTRRSDWRLSRQHCSILCSTALPLGLMSSITAIGSVLLQSSINALGTVYVTAATTANKVHAIMYRPLEAIWTSMGTYCAQNVGASRWDRLVRGMRAALVLDAAYSVLAFAIAFFFSNPMFMLFLDESSRSILPFSRQYLLTTVGSYFLLGMLGVFRPALQGMRKTIYSTISGLTEMVGRGLTGFLIPFFGFQAACFSCTIAWILAVAIVAPAFFICYHRAVRAAPGLPQR